MELNEVIQRRRSIRSYQPDAELPREMIEQLIDAAQQAPSWKNSQTARLYFVTAPDKKAEVLSALPAFNQKRAGDASALIVTSFVRGVSGHTEGKPDNELGDQWGAYDLGLNNALLLLKATDLGLDTLIMGLRDADAIRAALSIPENEVLASVIALGKRVSDPVAPQRKAPDEVARII